MRSEPLGNIGGLGRLNDDPILALLKISAATFCSTKRLPKRGASSGVEPLVVAEQAEEFANHEPHSPDSSDGHCIENGYE